MFLLWFFLCTAYAQSPIHTPQLPLTDTQLRASPVPVTCVGCGGSGGLSEGLTGVAVPTSATLMGASDGTLLQPLTISGDGDLFTHDSDVWQAITNAQTSYGASGPSFGPQVYGYVTTLPLSGLTDTSNYPLSLTTGGLLRVDGSNVTQPVSIAGTITTTGGLTDTQLRATAVPVSGTFYQATQPVSLATAPTTPVTGTFWQATQPVSIATAPVLVAGSAIIGKVGIDQTTPGTTNGVQVNAALPAGSNVIGHVIVDTAPSTAVTGPLTDTQLRASAVPISVATIPSHAVTNAGTFAVQNTTPTALTIHSAAITIGTSAVRLTYNGSAPSATRVLLVAQYLTGGTANCFFGPSGVTSTSTTRGVQMAAGQIFTFSNDAGDYYAICDASSQTFLITEQ